MKTNMRARNLSFLLIAVAVVAVSAAADGGTDVRPIRIVLIGDSTVASYAKPPKDRPDLTGWGQVFGEFFNHRVTVLNHAQSGRSSKSFIREGLWQKALDAKGDYVFIQFGHNDSPGKGDRSTDPNTDFRDYLRQYIDQSRAAGARPVLVTPVARRTFVDGKIHTTLQPYADAMLKVGKEKGVPVIDLHAAGMELFGRLGDAGSADLTASAGDRTHFSRKGAIAMAHLVAEAVRTTVPELKPYLKSLAPTAKDAPAGKRPNIVVVLTDDMGFSDLGCYGGEIHTPNLDRLAAHGLRFTQFYNTARCCPTRASLLTGLYPHQAAVGHMMGDKGLDGYHGDLSRNAVTIAEVLKTAGYATYATGKWHVTPFDQKRDSKHNWPLQRGFARYYGIIGGAANYFDPATLVRDNTPIKASADSDYKPEHYYLTDAISDHAARFVQEHAQERPGQPLFLYVAYTAAHWPLHAPEGEIAKYKGKYDGGYEPLRRAHFERLRQMGIIQPGWDLSPQDGDWSKVRSKAWEARCMEVYAAQVDRMDQGVGKIVETLTKNKLLENTLLFYLQDNGACAEGMGRAGNKVGVALPMPGPTDTFIAYGQAWANVSNTPFRYYKHFVHEGGIATPLIAHWPAGIKRRGELEHQPGHLIDIMATCVDVSGAKYPAQFAGHSIQPMEGRSLVPALDGRAIQREAIFWEHEGNRALRVGEWKLVAKGPRGPWELYDMEKDRTEMHDLAAAQPERVREMTTQWERWAQRTQAVPWPWGKPYGKEKAEPKPKKAKPGKAQATAGNSAGATDDLGCAAVKAAMRHGACGACRARVEYAPGDDSSSGGAL